MSGSPYDDPDVAMDCYGDIPIGTEQHENHSLFLVLQHMEIDDMPDTTVDIEVDMWDAPAGQRVSTFRYNKDDDDIYHRGKTYRRRKSKHKRNISQPSPLGADFLADLEQVIKANPPPIPALVKAEIQAQALTDIEEAKGAANNSVDDESDSDLDEPTSETNGQASTATPPDSAATASPSTTTESAKLLAEAREVFNKELRKTAKTPIVAPDYESLKKQVYLLQEEAGALERKLLEHKDVSDSVIVGQQRQIEELCKSLDAVKDWSQDGPALEGMYNDLKARNAKLEDELDEAIAARQAVCDERDVLAKVIESIQQLQIDPNDLQTNQCSDNDVSADETSFSEQDTDQVSSTISSNTSTSSVIQAAAAIKKPEIRKLVLPEQSSSESSSEEKAARNKHSKKRTSKKQTSAGPKPERKTDATSSSKIADKASPAAQKLATELATARHQLSGCHKNTLIHKRLIWELRTEVKLLAESQQKDLQTIQDAGEEQDNLRRQLSESHSQSAIRDESLQTLQETIQSLRDELVAFKQQGIDLAADSETLIKDNRALKASRSDPSRYQLESTKLKQSRQETEDKKNELEQTLQEFLDENQRIRAELEELHRSHDEEAVYRRRAAAAGERLEQFSNTAVSREDYETVKSNSALLHKANEILAATKEELAGMVQYYEAKFEAISRASPPATTSQQLRLYADALKRNSIGTKSERKQTIKEVKKVVAEQRGESFQAMRLTMWNLEEQWKEEFGMQGAYCKDRSASLALPVGDRSILRGAAIAV